MLFVRVRVSAAGYHDHKFCHTLNRKQLGFGTLAAVIWCIVLRVLVRRTAVFQKHDADDDFIFDKHISKITQ